MQHIDRFAILRNTATYEAYQARNRAILRAGQPFTILAATFAAVLYGAGLPLFFRHLLGQLLGPEHQNLIPMVTRWYAGLAGVCALGLAVCVALAFVRIQRYRRDHPIPDEWLLAPGSE